MEHVQCPRLFKAFIPAFALMLALAPSPGTPNSPPYVQSAPPSAERLRPVRAEATDRVPDPRRARMFTAFLAALAMSGAAGSR